MKRPVITTMLAATMVLASGATVAAQQHGPGTPALAPAPTGAAADQHAQSAPQMMEMCRQMMGHSGRMGGMGGGMMGSGMMDMPMMGGDPKQHADMMAMRGEMMKAMGDIMVKYAERMRPAK
jgi:hypothetical protein